MNFEFMGSIVPNVAQVSFTKDVKSGAAGSINYGDLVRPDDGNPGYVKKGVNADTATLFSTCYYAISTSTDTAAADGTVEVLYCPSMLLKGTATTPANLLQAVIDTRVTLDVAGDAQTIDENDTGTGFMRIQRPVGGVANFDTTNGYGVMVVVNEPLN